MSVPTYKRNEATSQFIQTAQQLLKFTLQKCLKMPKRYTFFIATDLVKTTETIYKNVCIIQKLYEPTQEHITQKIKLCEENIGLLNYLTSQLDIVKVYMGNSKSFTLNTFKTWLAYIDTEKRLLDGLIKKMK